MAHYKYFIKSLLITKRDSRTFYQSLTKKLRMKNLDDLLHLVCKLLIGFVTVTVELLILLFEKLVIYMLHLYLFFLVQLFFFELEIIHFCGFCLPLRAENFSYFKFLVSASYQSISHAYTLFRNIFEIPKRSRRIFRKVFLNSFSFLRSAKGFFN